MRVSVFGGSQPKESDAAYTEAKELGKLLAQRGHTVLTGGYIGTMEAVSRGASEAGGHVIGVTCEDIEAWRPIRANAWVKEEIRKKTLIERLTALIRRIGRGARAPRRPRHTDRNFLDLEFDDRGVPAPEAADTDRRGLAVRLRSVLPGAGRLYPCPSTRDIKFCEGCADCHGNAEISRGFDTSEKAPLYSTTDR